MQTTLEWLYTVQELNPKPSFWMVTMQSVYQFHIKKGPDLKQDYTWFELGLNQIQERRKPWLNKFQTKENQNISKIVKE